MTSAAERLINLHNKRIVSNRKSTPIRPEDTYLTGYSPGQVEMYYPTDTSLAEEFIWDIMTGLSGNVSYGPSELRQLYEIGYHPAFFGKETPPSNNILAAKATYVLPRLVATEHIPLLANAEIHFTDNAKDFYRQENRKNISTFIPDKRARVYRVDKGENGRVHITYLLKHSYVENYIDAFELVSFLAFTEFFKKQILSSSFNFEGEEGKKLEKNLKTLGFNKDSINDYASEQNQELVLSPSEYFSLNSPCNIYIETDLDRKGELWEHDSDVISDAVWMIKKSLEKTYGVMPDHVIMGNDFSIPLMATLGLFNHHDIERVFGLASPNNLNPEEQTLRKEEIEQEIAKIPNEIDKETIRKFRVYQYLNLYKGDNPELINMKRLLDSTVNKMRNRIVSAGATGLGSPIDIIDFSQLPEGLIKQIEHPKIRELILRLHAKRARILSLAYPLGENVYPLVKLFNQKLGIENIGFFGKVGAVVDEEGKGVRRGRVVIPELFTRVGETGKTVFHKFRNLLREKDVMLIPSADDIEAIICTNSVFLQTAQDIRTYREIARQLKEDPKTLIDSESFYLQQVCQELNINPAIIYYVSDNTNIDGSLDEDMTKAMGAQGTLAALESPLTILNRWFADAE